jgi:hypothetical protein
MERAGLSKKDLPPRVLIEEVARWSVPLDSLKGLPPLSLGKRPCFSPEMRRFLRIVAMFLIGYLIFISFIPRVIIPA